MQTLAKVSVKIGGINRTSRTSVRVEDAEFRFDPEGSFDDLYARAEERIVAALAAFDIRTLRPDTNLYAKPSQGATQQGWVALTESNWTAIVSTVRTNFQRRRKNTGPLCLELFSFAVRENQAGDATRRRATRNRIQQAAEDIVEFLAERPNVQVGVIARTHWEMTQACQPAGTAVAVPETATFRQMQHLDAVGAANPPEDRDEAVFQTIPVRINGSTELQLTFNVQGLRAILGLPSHNAMGSGIFSAFVPPPEPEEDIEDVDHQED
ncbi:hypothetical protein PR003_g11401 [Phytophthora rubi]|uniref:Uncharacterized protein n=1 Tax=Phytophthora rubi TaxID=129364 RepID=A0A6A3KX10_9STRA|nr:hypothetical protein PR002_g27136 [Phytophthora rubi]KAE9008054.1 hypothetical protein PR001_g16803 [Phytophthora rubi]KAE9338662.1 hypothetical protein PR003_g11401 [Phytophthora rubi]